MTLRFSRRMTLFLALASILLSGGFIFGTKHFDNYFPLQEGQSLEYEVKRSKDGAVVEQVKEKVTNLAEQTLEGKRVVPRKYDIGGKTFLAFFNRDTEGIMFMATKGEKDAKPNLLPHPFYYIKNPLEVGASWGKGDGPKGRIDSVSETVTVPAGTFRKCVKVKITYPGSMPMSEGTLWFAEKVGIVKSTYVYKNAMKEEFQLLAAH